MFWENFLANLTSGIALRFFKSRKTKRLKSEQENNKQKNENDQKINDDFRRQIVGIQIINKKTFVIFNNKNGQHISTTATGIGDEDLNKIINKQD